MSLLRMQARAAAMAAALMVVGAPVGEQLAPTAPQVPRPAHELTNNKRRNRRKEQSEKLRGQRREAHETNRESSRSSWLSWFDARAADEVRFVALVNKMTNHERNQWARAGYPGKELVGGNIDALMPFAQAAARRLDGTHVCLAEPARD